MKKVITAVVAFVIVALMALGYMQASHHSSQAAGKLDPKELIFEHLGDAYGPARNRARLRRLVALLHVVPRAGRSRV